MGLPARQGESRHGSGGIKRLRGGGERVNVLLKTQDSLILMSLGGGMLVNPPFTLVALHDYGT